MTEITTQVTTTPAATDLIAELKAEHGNLIFHLSDGNVGRRLNVLRYANLNKQL